MRLRIRHETTYRYAVPAKSVIQLLRLTPRNHEGQHVIDWRIDISTDCRLRSSEDAFGNILHSFTADGPIDALTIHVEGEVETFDTMSVVRGAVERFPPELYLCDTPLTAAEVDLRAFARAATDHEGDALARLHALLAATHQIMVFDADRTHAPTTAVESFARKRGVREDFTQVFIACARHLGSPARYVGGYVMGRDGDGEQTAGHAWAEAHVDGLGWVGFDPTRGICPLEHYVRVAMGLDYLGASPVRGTQFGGVSETLSVMVQVVPARTQTQRQS